MNEKLIEKILEKYLFWNEINQKEESESVFIWKYIILRARNAGVHFWKLEYAKNWVYRLSESRRLYRWRIKNKNWVSLSELAEKWIDEEYSMVCVEIPLIEITEKEWAELIPVNSIESFKNIKNYIPNN
jgi:hypothetical protein